MQQNLADLLKQGEGVSLDFKQKITSCDKIAKTLCSFANTVGGIILVGVKDDRTITGIDPEEEKYMLEQAALHYCQPAITLSYEEIEEEDELIVLKVYVAPSDQKPHASRTKGGDWKVYIRQRDKSLPAGKHMIRHLRQSPLEALPGELIPADKNETRLLEYLQTQERITVAELAILFNFSRRRAQRLLLTMVQKGFIRLFEHEKEDYYA